MTKFGDNAALRGFVSQKVFLGGNSRCGERRKKELANGVRTGKSFKKDSKIRNVGIYKGSNWVENL